MTLSKLSFRNALLKDLPKIVEIYNSTISSRMVTADTEQVTVESRIKWLGEHTADKRPLWIIEDQHKNTLGWVSFQSFYGRPAYDSTAEISIYLETSQRGKGLGKEVLRHCIDTASRLGIKTLLGFLFAHNLPSLKLFTQFGFQEWANLPNVALLDGVERSLKILGRRVP